MSVLDNLLVFCVAKSVSVTYLLTYLKAKCFSLRHGSFERKHSFQEGDFTLLHFNIFELKKELVYAQR